MLDLSGSVRLALAGLSDFAQKLAAHGLFFAVADRGGFLEVLAFLPLADDALFFDHALEALDRLLERLIVVYDDLADKKSPPLDRGKYYTDWRTLVKTDKGLRIAGHPGHA